MKKQYILVFLISILCLLLYFVLSHKYKEYRINKDTILMLKNSNTDLKENINEKKEEVDYKNSKAYKNKILKDEQGLKSKGEKVLYITTEHDYNKFTTPYKLEIQELEEKEEVSNLNYLSNLEKWKKFLFGDN